MLPNNNTSEIKFAVEVTPRKAVKYSLTPTKQAVVDTALRSAVGTQKIVLTNYSVSLLNLKIV